MNAVKEFEDRFSGEIIDMLILTKESVGGGAISGDMLIPSIDFVASVNLETGELSLEKGRLEWIIKNSPDRKGWGYNFQQLKIYHIKARKNILIELKKYMSKTMNNCYMIVKVIEEDASEPRLEKIKEKLSKPVVIKDEIFGEFKLDRKFSWFEGEIDWLGDKCKVSLDTDEEDGDTAEKALEVLKVLYKNLQNYDNNFRTFAASELTETANEWLQEEEDEAVQITEEEFAKRMEIGELSIASDGELTLYYEDDDMFLGHAIEVDANINGEISGADIVG